MKPIKKSGVFMLYSVLSIVFGATIILSLFWGGSFIYSLLAGKPMLTPDAFPVNIFMTNNHYLANHEGNVFLGDLSGQLLFLNPPIGLQIYSGLYTVIIWSVLSYIIFLMRKIIWTTMQGNPFIKDNGSRLRIIAILIINVPLVLNFMQSRIIYSLIQTIKIENVIITHSGNREMFYVFLGVGLFFLILSEVFRIGTSLKEENELTV